MNDLLRPKFLTRCLSEVRCTFLPFAIANVPKFGKTPNGLGLPDVSEETLTDPSVAHEQISKASL